MGPRRSLADDDEDTTTAEPPGPPARRAFENSIELDISLLAAAEADDVATVRLPAVVDVTPYSLGIATVAGFCEELVRRNTRVPAHMQRVFATSKDQQRTVRILICQGESRRIEDNIVLGELVLDGVEPRPRGDTQIEVTFSIDASGILSVRARDGLSGREQHAQLHILGTPSVEEVQAAASRLRRLRS